MTATSLTLQLAALALHSITIPYYRRPPATPLMLMYICTHSVQLAPPIAVGLLDQADAPTHRRPAVEDGSSNESSRCRLLRRQRIGRRRSVDEIRNPAGSTRGAAGTPTSSLSSSHSSSPQCILISSISVGFSRPVSSSSSARFSRPVSSRCGVLPWRHGRLVSCPSEPQGPRSRRTGSAWVWVARRASRPSTTNFLPFGTPSTFISWSSEQLAAKSPPA